MTEVQKNNSEQQDTQPEVNEYVQQLQSIQEQFGTDGFDDFKSYLESDILSESAKNNILAVLNGKTQFDQINIEDYILMSGYPNEETIYDFLKEFTLDEKLEQKEKQNQTEPKLSQNQSVLDQTEAKLDQNESEKKWTEQQRDDILSILNDNKDFQKNLKEENEVGEFKKLLDNIGDSDGLSKLQAFLEKNDNLTAIHTYLLEQPGWEHSNDYTTFKNIVTKLSITFDFKKAREKYNQDSILDPGNNERMLDQARLKGGLNYGNVVRENQFLRSGDVEIDISKRPPLRTILAEGGDYRLEAKIPIGIFKETIWKFESKRKDWKEKSEELYGELEKLNWAYEQINSLINDEEELIDLDIELWVTDKDNSLKLKQLLQNQKDIKEQLDQKEAEYEKHKQKLEQIKINYAKSLDADVKGQALRLKEEDKKKRDILQFIWETTAYAIPQDTMLEIFETINKSSMSIQVSGGINVNGIDLETFTLKGEGIPNVWDSIWQAKIEKIFAEIFNKMISGDSWHPIDVNTVANTGSPTFSDSEGNVITSLAIEGHIKKSLGMDSVGRSTKWVILENLQKTETQK